jgi:SAM-dependent methyltransferase
VSTSWDAEQYEGKHSFVWRLGAGVVELLAPQSGERILDVGCGTGQLTAEIAKQGAQVVGLDSSATMIGQARQNYPGLAFVLGDATSFHFEEPFDAVFSNAALHWVKEADAAAESIGRALKPGGRFVAEFGGHGNTRSVLSALRAALGPESDARCHWYYPSSASMGRCWSGTGSRYVTPSCSTGRHHWRARTEWKTGCGCSATVFSKVCPPITSSPRCGK